MKKLLLPLLISSAISPAIAQDITADNILDMGTLRADNSGWSYIHHYTLNGAEVMSADGRVVIGQADTDMGSMGWFRYNTADETMTGLGSLTTNGTGWVYVQALSADGRVIAGEASTDEGDNHVFRHTEGDSRMTDLGTLKADNSGTSSFRFMSADGRVIVGYADTDEGYNHIFRYNEGDSRLTDLGTLTSDGSGWSEARVLSADGRVVAGDAITDEGTMHVFRHNEGDSRMTDLGTLRNDNTGSSHLAYTYSGSVANGMMSADGRVVVGMADTDEGTMHLFRHNEGDSRLTDLGTLTSDGSGWAEAYFLSADGREVVGEATTDEGPRRVFRHSEGDSRMTDLGTLRSDNTGSSHLAQPPVAGHLVSADGRVVVGYADTDDGYKHVFRHNIGDSRLTDLGTLTSDGSGWSEARVLSADGRVVAGEATTDEGTSHVFRHNEGDSRMTDLGTLRSDNTGSSYLAHSPLGKILLSVDGRVVVGMADTDEGTTQLFRHREGDVRLTGLGTLDDGSGWAQPYALSADGRVVVGDASTEVGDSHAFFHFEGSNGMVDLGTLRAGNAGWSRAEVVSDDGSVVAGTSETEDGDSHAVLWKINIPLPLTPLEPAIPAKPDESGDTDTDSDADSDGGTDPVNPPTFVMVDANNSVTAMAETAGQAREALSLYQNALDSLASSRCQLGARDYCVGAFSQLSHVSSSDRVASGLYGATRLPAESWIVGAAFSLGDTTDLAGGYDTRGSNRPGVGLFTRYQSARDNSGLGVDASWSFIEQDVSITRQTLLNTEAGKGNSTVKGQQARLVMTYGFRPEAETLVSPLLAVKYQDVYRKGYTENRQAAFPATYTRMGDKSVSLQTGVDLSREVSDRVRVDGGLGANVNLNRQRDAFTGRIEYIGAYAYDGGKTQDVMPYAYTGINVAVTPSSVVRVNAGWEQTVYGKDAVQTGVSYSYRW